MSKEVKTCKNCGEPVMKVNYAFGPEWAHFLVGSSFPTERRGNAWRWCRTTLAEVEEDV